MQLPCQSCNKGVRLMGLKWLVFLIGPINLIGMWFGEHQRVNIIKTHV